METQQQETSLASKIREFRYEQRLSLVSFLGSQPESAERTRIAVGLVQELAMHHVFERFTKEQRAALLDRLESLSALAPDSTKPHGLGAKSSIAEHVQQQLF